MTALAQSSAMAQLGKKSLLPEGQVFLPTGNYSPMEKSARVYGKYLELTGDQKFTDGTDYDWDVNDTAVALDFKAGSAVISAGYSTSTSTISATIGGVTAEQESVTTNLGGRLTYLFGGSGVAALEVFSQERTRTINFSGGVSATGSADTGFIDISLGASMDVSESIRIGGAFSPEVSDKGEYSGDLTGTTRTGHGTQFRAGLGYNTPDFAAGLDFAMESESQDAAAQAERFIIAAAEVLFGDTSLTGRFAFYQGEPLRIDGSLLAPDTEGTFISVLAKFRVGDGVLGVGFSKQDDEGFATGTPSEDANRFDSASLIGFTVQFSADF